MKKPYVLILALISGLIFGLILHPLKDNNIIQFIADQLLYPVGQIFIRVILMVVVPMVLSALVLGARDLAKGNSLGKVIGKTIKYTLIMSLCSVIIGVTLVNVFQPGRGFSQIQNVAGAPQALDKIKSNADRAKPFSQIIIELIPKNPLASAVNAFEGEMLSFMVFALIFGIAL